MLYLIGGPPRVGKTRLAKALQDRTGVSGVSTDFLREASACLEPSLERSTWREAEVHPKLGHFISVFCRSASRQTSYTVEGDALDPQTVGRLATRRVVRSIFLLALQVDDEYFGVDPGWLATVSSDERELAIEQIVNASRELKRQCARWEIPVLDVTSCDRPQEAALAQLISG